MKKFLTILSLTMLLFGSQAMAIGLPNNSYIQRHTPQQENLHAVHGEVQKYTLVSEAKYTYTTETISTLDSETDFHEFSKAVVDKIVGFVSMLILSLSSFGNSVADEMHAVHNWIITGLPPQV